MLFSVRVRVEASAIFLKCITTFILVYTFNVSDIIVLHMYVGLYS
jgi:hypothetical protein